MKTKTNYIDVLRAGRDLVENILKKKKKKKQAEFQEVPMDLEAIDASLTAANS